MTTREQGQASAGSSVAQLMERLSAPVSALVRDELALATAEMKHKGAQAGVGSRSALRDQAAERSNEFQARVIDQATAGAGAIRGVVSRIPPHRWVKLAGTGFLLIAFTLVTRKVIR